MSLFRTEVEVHQFDYSDAKILTELGPWGQEGMRLVAIHDRGRDGKKRYLYFERTIVKGLTIKWEQKRIVVGGDERVADATIRREALTGWRLTAVYCGKDNMIQLFFCKQLPPPDNIEEGNKK